MSVSASTVWEVRTTGSDLNGGGFDATLGGTDYSRQDAAQASGTASSVGTTVTATAGIFTAAMVGNYVCGAGVRKRITGYTSPTVVTVDSAPGWSGVAINVGGAVQSLGALGAVAVPGNVLYMLQGGATAYSVNTSAQNVSQGRANFVNALLTGTISVVGYDTTRSIDNDDENHPLLKNTSGIALGTATCGIVGTSASEGILDVRNVDVDANNTASICFATDLVTGGWLTCFDCLTRNVTFPGTGFYNGQANRCVAVNCSDGFALATVEACVAVSCSNIGFFSTNGNEMCIAISCDVGFLNPRIPADACVAYNSTTDGFQLANGAFNIYTNMVAWGSGGKGFTAIDADSTGSHWLNCAGGSNGSGNTDPSAGRFIGFVNLTQDPFVDGANGNFALNDLPDGGALLKSVGFPEDFPYINTKSYRNIGLAQHQCLVSVQVPLLRLRQERWSLTVPPGG